MSKKPLTGTTKLAQATPLTVAPELASEGPRLVRRKPKTTLKNFRLSDSDIQRLHKITAAINGESEKFFSETAIIKGLLALGEKTNPARLLRVMKEVL
jgi:hypothetical protein